MTITIANIGQRVQAVNDRGARYTGILRAFAGSKVFITCDLVDLGYGLERCNETHCFPVAQVEPMNSWIEITEGHALAPGSRFLVIEENDDGSVLAWRDGIKPGESGAGTLVHKDFYRAVEV